MLMKKIWLINHYAMPPKLEPRIRTIKFAEYLTKEGYDVTVFGASSMHNMPINLIENNESYLLKDYDGLKFVHIKARSYSNYFSRVINLLEFPIRIYINSSKFDKPDIILHTATVPFGNIIYFLAKKLKSRYIVEVLDLWPESFYMTGLIGKKNPIMPILYYFEKWLYKKADKLVFSMEGGKDYVIRKKWDTDNGGPINIKKIMYINNGVDLTEFNENVKNYHLEDEDLNDKNTFKVIYIGSIRLFNNVRLLIDAADRLKHIKEVKFLIYGDGNDRDNLQEYVKLHRIDNVIFKEKFVNKEFIPYILSKSSLNVVNYQQNGIWEYGGSQSKMFQYLASGRPIISNIVPGYCLIRKYKCGISSSFTDSEDYANAILKIVNLSEDEYLIMCTNALEGAKTFDYPLLTQKLISLFD
jgi:glycosyltransferase involved in cell wall biosynthesis